MDKESLHNEERIVISGMSGAYPQANSVQELSDVLYNKINPIKPTNRWQYDHLEFSRYLGEIRDLDLFDSQFFKVNYQTSHIMDPMSRMLLEQTYHAIYDAGLWPEYFSGMKVGVFCGSSTSDTEKACFNTKSIKTKPRLLGASKTFFGNRISYWLNCVGPSVTIDNDNSSSMTALELAFHSIRSGYSEAAIVTGSYLCLCPQALIHYGRVVPLSADGKTKSFDANADGNVVSEAVNVLILQKAKDALRIYADVVNVKTSFIANSNCENFPNLEFIKSTRLSPDFMKQFYDESAISPLEVEYVEAIGSGVPEADKAELDTIDEVYCKNRTDVLLVGSVQSNIGNTMAASGISAITKVLLGYQTGSLAGNLHYVSPRQDVTGITDDRIRILAKNTNFRRTYVAVNNISMTGVNGVALLRGHFKPKNNEQYKSRIPRLLTISSRQESEVLKMIDYFKSRPIDPEEIGLLHNIHEHAISGHMGRGFIILDADQNDKTNSLYEYVGSYDEVTRPLWFVYSGMGSQWAGMGTQLMQIPTFVAAIERCQKVLDSKGIDIVHIITSPDQTIFDNILNSFVGIAAIQIGLTDILTEIGLFPDKIIGHSVGELGCAYADGCMTAEEMILSSYYRGLVSLQTQLIHGSMAAVGLGYTGISKLCPREIDVACHNGPESSTISGPADIVLEFVDSLRFKGVFAKIVQSSNIAYHSRYIQDAGPNLLSHLKNVIKTPKLRSPRWLSTSVPQKNWNQSDAKYNSAEYHTNNLLNPVLFEETIRNIPSNAVLVEVAPYGLLQAILKRSLPDSVHHIPLARRNYENNIIHILSSIGRLYTLGYTPKIKKLYPKVEYPVSTETPSLSHLNELAHIEQWATEHTAKFNRRNAAGCEFVIPIQDQANSYLKGHVIKNQILYPFTAALVAVWDTLAMSIGRSRQTLSVKFQDVHLFSQPAISEHYPLKITVALHRGSGNFEVLYDTLTLLTGKVLQEFKTNPKTNKITNTTKNWTCDVLKAHDVYNLLSERDYNYSGEFRSIQNTNVSITNAQLIWHQNWVTFIDGMLQLNMLKHRNDGVSQPVYIETICINLNNHHNSPSETMLAIIDETLQLTVCGGVTIQNIKFRELPLLPGEILELKPKSHQRGIAKLSIPNGQDKKDIVLQLVQPKKLTSLKWVHKILQTNKTSAKVTVHYAGLTRRDIENFSKIQSTSDNDDEYNALNCFGIDFSGTTERGDRVMGVVSDGSCCSHVMARPELLWPVPDGWSLEDAATVPCAYMEAFYCLGIKAQVCPSSNILVHDGACAFGQAVISIALGIGCQVFTTVDEIRKKHYLLRMFPNLKENYIGYSRDQAFYDMVLSQTNGKGCDIVICSLERDLMDASLNCCGQFGITFDTAYITGQQSFTLGMGHFFRGRNYFQTGYRNFLYNNDLKEVQFLQLLISEGISKGYVRPLSRVTYEVTEIQRALSLQSNSQQNGKVLIHMENILVTEEAKILLTPEHSHIVFCNEETLGLHLADMLVKRFGAKKLYLHFENPPAYINYKIRYWKNIGVQVTMFSQHLVNKKELVNLFNDVSEPVEGVYCIATKNQDKNQKKVLSLVVDLDVTTRELCPDLKYFGVITNNQGNDCEKICLAREKADLPATLIGLTGIDNITTEEKCFGTNMKYCRGVINAMESALMSPYSIFTVEMPQSRHYSPLHEISALAGVNLPKEIQEDTTLQDLGFGHIQLGAINTFFRNNYNVSMKENEILSLTVQRIQDIDDSIKREETKLNQSLDLFYSHVGSDEMKTAEEIISLPTMFDRDILNYEEFDVGKTYLCIIPGLEGYPDRFQTLCECLKLPALVLIPSTDKRDETIQQMAERLSKILLQKIGIKDTFYLLGYENGMFVALEMAAILEKHGISGTVFFLGCTPDEFQRVLNEVINNIGSEEKLQNAILLHMYNLVMKDNNTGELEMAISETTTWLQKLDIYIRALKTQTTHSIQYLRLIVETAYQRIRETCQYVSSPVKLKSKLVILQSSDTNVLSLNELQNRSEHPVNVHYLASPLAFVTSDVNCATIINQHLSPDVLNKFNTKNMCDSYLILESNNAI